MHKKNIDNLTAIFWYLEQESYMVFVVEKGTILVYENISDEPDNKDDTKISRQELVFTYPYFSKFLDDIERDVVDKTKQQSEEQDRKSGVRDFPEGIPEKHKEH